MRLAEGIQKAIDYIEENITQELDLGQIARQAALSPHYFQKIFYILCGITVGEYIRSRRLTLAGDELAKTGTKVIDVAFKYGFASPESFARAFTRFHGVAPSQAKRSNARLRSFSRLKVQIILKGGNSMNYEIVVKESFTVLEKVERQQVADEQNTIPEFWDKSLRDGTIETLLQYALDRTYVFGICYGNGHSDNEHFDYAIAVQCSPDTAAPEGFRVSVIPKRTWLKFECTGAMPKAIQDLWHEISAEFLPVSDHQPTYEMDIEAYPSGDMTAEDYKSQIWLPIVDK